MAQPPKGKSRPLRLVKPPYGPADYDHLEHSAIQALGRGDANETQQRRALDWIVRQAAMTYDEPFIPDSARATDYLLGRRSVGLQIVKLLNTKVNRPGLENKDG